jgi:Flp pilus assembly secretin CpaC
MSTNGWIRGVARSTAFLVVLAGASAHAREGVRSIPLAAVAPQDNRNIADTRPSALEAGKPASPMSRGELSVSVDRAKVIKLPEKTQTVIIGNPGVADIAIQKSGVVVLTGKSFGVTNFIALDASGSMIGESMVSVTAPNEATLTVQRGMDRQTYSCTPNCHPSVALGDSGGFFAETKGQAEQHSAFTGTR